MLCEKCNLNQAKLIRQKTQSRICTQCFFEEVENEIHQTIISNNLFQNQKDIVIGASGGKDSTFLIHILTLLNDKFNYGLKIKLLAIDEGIKGYRDDSLETVKQNAETYKLPLLLLSFKELYGYSLDEIVQMIGQTSTCTWCGVFRRQALEIGTRKLNSGILVTGHNADDLAETILMNFLRGDLNRINRQMQIQIQETPGGIDIVNRIKPLKYIYEKDIVLYAHYKKLLYFSTECSYFPNSYRGNVRELLKQLEKVKPSSIIDIIHSGESIKVKTNEKNTKFLEEKLLQCEKCKMFTNNTICQACKLVEQLNKGVSKQIIQIKND